MRTEAELVELAKAGDREAFADLVRSHQRLAYRAAWLVLRSDQEAADAAQEAFVKAWRALPRFRSGSPFAPWIARIASNQAKNQVRSAVRRRRLAERISREPESPAPDVADAAIDDERLQSLLAAVDRLPARYRDAVRYRYLLEMSELETAAALGVASGTVKSRLHRGLDRLRHELGEGST